MTAAGPLITAAELADLEAAVGRAFAGGDDRHLRVLGYGEISSVLAWDTARGPVAVKRLPPFPDRPRFDAYAATVADYLAALAAGGVTPVTTELASAAAPGGAVVAYLVQPILPAATLGPRRLAVAGGDEVERVLAAIVERVVGVVDGRRGLDAQLSNWAIDGERLAYLDVSTPMLRDDAAMHDLTLTKAATICWRFRMVATPFWMSRSASVSCRMIAAFGRMGTG